MKPPTTTTNNPPFFFFFLSPSDLENEADSSAHFLPPARLFPSGRLISDPNNPALYTNRAMARLKLGQWDNAVADCTACLRLAPDSIKAHYSLSQAHLALRAYDDALQHARIAHALCAKAADKSLGTLTAHVLRCKKEAWDAAERRRLRENADLEAEVIGLLERERDAAVREAVGQQLEEGGDSSGGSEEARKEVAAEWDAKIARMREVFERARPPGEKRRTVPDWAIDDISFCVMVDPVIVSGSFFLSLDCLLC